MSRVRGSSRREFLKGAAAVGAGYWVAHSSQAEEVKSANEQVSFACIGIGGQGASDTADAAANGNVVAICDVDDNALNKAAGIYPKAKKFNDFRKMFDEFGSSFDAVTVSTPDHNHAVITAMAIRAGKHCYTQKPLTHNLYEARRIADMAREHKVVTQMGNQGTAYPGLRRAAALVRAGALGSVQEIHVWTNRPIWAQGGPRPKDALTLPKHLHWDLWLGCAKERPYGAGYHPFSWRGFWEFGTGALGDMACHTVNMPYMALDLRNPVSVEAETSGHNKETFPKWSIIHYEFAETEHRKPVKLIWYDGGKRPPRALFDGQKQSASGSLMIGEKGKLYSPADYAEQYLFLGDAGQPDIDLPNPPKHFPEFVRGIQGGPPPTSNFPSYAGPLTETVLLGNLAVWAGKKVEWDAEKLKATNAPELDELIKREYRAGYSL